MLLMTTRGRAFIIHLMCLVFPGENMVKDAHVAASKPMFVYALRTCAACFNIMYCPPMIPTAHPLRKCVRLLILSRDTCNMNKTFFQLLECVSITASNNVKRSPSAPAVGRHSFISKFYTQKQQQTVGVLINHVVTIQALDAMNEENIDRVVNPDKNFAFRVALSDLILMKATEMPVGIIMWLTDVLTTKLIAPLKSISSCTYIGRNNVSTRNRC